MKLFSSHKASVILLLALGAAACNSPQNSVPQNGASKPKTPDAAPSASLPPAVAAFARSVHAYTRKNCSGCHGASQAPLFAVAEIEKAYAASKPFADFDKVSQSTFVKRAMNGHCGANCKTDGAAMTAAIEEWKKAEQATNPPPIDPNAGRTFTETLELPNNLPTGTEFALLRWELQGARITLEAQRFGNDGFRFRKPRAGVRSGSLTLQDIRVHLNGVTAKKPRFHSIDAVVFALSSGAMDDALSGFPVLSAANEIIVPVDKAEPDSAPRESSIKLSFAKFTLDDQRNPGCFALELFKSKVLPLTEARDCYSCHGGGPDLAEGLETARKHLDMKTNDAEICSAFLQRVSRKTPLASPLILYPMGNKELHPAVLPFIEEIVPNWTDWIAAEQAAIEDPKP